MAERWIVTVNGSSTVLPVTNRQGAVRVIGQETPAPEPVDSMAERTEGALVTSRGWQNRQVTLRLEVERPTDQWWDVVHDFGALPDEAEGEGTVPGFTGTTRRVDGAGSPIVPAIRDLAQIVGEMQSADGSIAGTLTRVMESGERIVYDVVSAAMPDGPAWTQEVYLRDATQVTLRFTCLPFARGVELLLGSAARTARQRLVTVGGLQVPGDVAALTRIELSGATADQSSVLYAIDQPAAGAAGPELQCATLDRPVAATLVTSDGSVATQVVQRAASPAAIPDGLWEPGVFLRQSGAPLVAPGRYAIWVRVLCASGDRVRLRWASGSRVTGMTTNDPVTLRGGGWELVCLGQVAVRDGAGLDGVVESGLPHASAIQFDVLLLVPVACSAQAYAATAPPVAEIVAADPMTGSGAVGGSAVPTGGKWTRYGASADITRGAIYATRTAVAAEAGLADGVGIPTAAARISADVSTPWNGTGGGSAAGDGGVWIGNAAGATVVAGPSGYTGAGSGTAGAWALYLAIVGVGRSCRARLIVVDGTTVKSTTWPIGKDHYKTTLALSYSTGVATVSEIGWSSEWRATVGVPAPPAGTFLAGIATHGSSTPNSSAGTLGWRDVVVIAAASSPDAIVYAGATTSIASSAASRTDPSGAVGLIVPQGERPHLPPAGRAGSAARVIVATVRGDLREQVDAAAADPLTVDVYATPRYLQVPG